jgi:hypothetical protein
VKLNDPLEKFELDFPEVTTGHFWEYRVPEKKKKKGRKLYARLYIIILF